MSPTALDAARRTFRPEPTPTELEYVFHALAEQWFAEAAMLSNPLKKFMHPSYQQIIGLGPRVVPLLLRDVAAGKGNWLWALAAITREDPIPAEDAGNIEKIAGRWLEWGRSRGYLHESQN